MPIQSKIYFDPDKKFWIGVIFESDVIDPNIEDDELLVLDAVRGATETEVRAEIHQSMELREWEGDLLEYRKRCASIDP